MADRTFAYGLATALAALGLAAPAAAQMPDTRPIAQTEALKAWKAICFDNSLDTAAQIKAAKAAPYSAVEGKAEPDGSRSFTGPTLQIWIKSDAKSHYCAVAANLSDEYDADASMRFVDPLTDVEPNMDGELAFWVIDTKDYNLAIGIGAAKRGSSVTTMLVGSGVDMK